MLLRKVITERRSRDRPIIVKEDPVTKSSCYGGFFEDRISRQKGTSYGSEYVGERYDRCEYAFSVFPLNALAVS